MRGASSRTRRTVTARSAPPVGWAARARSASTTEEDVGAGAATRSFAIRSILSADSVTASEARPPTRRGRGVDLSLAVILLLLLAPSVASAAGGTLQATLVDGGRDVTAAHPDATLVFLPNPPDPRTSRESAQRCRVAEPCDLLPGSYVVDVEDPSVVADVRPFVTVG